jgi:hypothetical protein
VKPILELSLSRAPAIGQVIALIAWLMNRTRRGWGVVTLIALITGVLLVGGFVIAGLIINAGEKQGIHH